MTHRTQQNFNAAAERMRTLLGVATAEEGQSLRAIGESIMTDVKNASPGRGVPVDTGVLRSTGRVDGPTGGKVTLSFGGAAAPYALVQHEDTTLHHTIGEARYLVRGVERWRSGGRLTVLRAFENLSRAIRLMAKTR
jgi:hypothetical protein